MGIQHCLAILTGGRNPVGIASEVAMGGGHVTLGCANPGLNYGSPLGLGASPLHHAKRSKGGHSESKTQGVRGSEYGRRQERAGLVQQPLPLMSGEGVFRENKVMGARIKGNLRRHL